MCPSDEASDAPEATNDVEQGQSAATVQIHCTTSVSIPARGIAKQGSDTLLLPGEEIALHVHGPRNIDVRLEKSSNVHPRDRIRFDDWSEGDTTTLRVGSRISGRSISQTPISVAWTLWGDRSTVTLTLIVTDVIRDLAEQD